MFLRHLFAVLLWSAHSVVTAYDLVGGYERVAFYYTYVMDCTANGGTPKKIAPGCAKRMQTGQTPCSFDQFVEYIAEPKPPKTGPDPINYPRITGQPFSAVDLPDMETTAQRTQALGLTSTVHPGYLVKGLDRADLWSEVLTEVGKESTRLMERPNVPDRLKDAGLGALEQVYVARREATWRVFAKKMTDNGHPEVPRVKTKVHPDSSREFLDFRPVARQYSKASGVSMSELSKTWDRSGAKGHKANNDALEKVLANKYNGCVY